MKMLTNVYIAEWCFLFIVFAITMTSIILQNFILLCVSLGLILTFAFYCWKFRELAQNLAKGYDLMEESMDDALGIKENKKYQKDETKEIDKSE